MHYTNTKKDTIALSDWATRNGYDDMVTAVLAEDYQMQHGRNGISQLIATSITDNGRAHSLLINVQAILYANYYNRIGEQGIKEIFTKKIATLKVNN